MNKHGPKPNPNKKTSQQKQAEYRKRNAEKIAAYESSPERKAKKAAVARLWREKKKQQQSG